MLTFSHPRCLRRKWFPPIPHGKICQIHLGKEPNALSKLPRKQHGRQKSMPSPRGKSDTEVWRPSRWFLGSTSRSPAQQFKQKTTLHIRHTSTSQIASLCKPMKSAQKGNNLDQRTDRIWPSSNICIINDVRTYP